MYLYLKMEFISTAGARHGEADTDVFVASCTFRLIPTVALEKRH
jgi:hypothetical protein